VRPGGRGEKIEVIGSPGNGGVADHGDWGMPSEGIEEGHRPGYSDVKLRNEAAADTSRNRFEVGKSDESIN